jgi:ubiquinone/menaquinone biosynthesis C-methylase UbiE
MNSSHVGKDYFGHDLLEASKSGTIFEKVFHNERIRMWLTTANYKNKKVLDVGCNTGIITIPLAKQGIEIIGIDNSRSDIRLAKKNLKKEGLSERIAMYANARKLPFKNNSFDIVLLSDLLEHTSDPKKASQEAIRVTKPGGLIYVTVPYHLHPVVRFDWLRKVLSSRKNVDEHPDIPFTYEKLKKFFPGMKVKEMTLVHYWVSILGVFQKPKNGKKHKTKGSF